MYQIGLSDELTSPKLRAEALAIAGIVALQSMLGRRAVHYAGPLAEVQAHVGKIAAPRKAKAPAKPKRVALLSGGEFFDARMLASRAVAADVGAAWHLVEGASQWATIPSKMRSFRTARGTLCKAKPDARLPAARYWPGGVLPEGIVPSPDMPRDRTPEHVVRAVQHRARTDRAYNNYWNALRSMASAREQLRANYSWGVYAMADRRERYRSAIAHAWAMRREARALAAVCNELAAYVHAPAAGLTPWVDSGRGYDIHPMLANLEAAHAEQRDADRARTDAALEAEADAERIATAEAEAAE